MIVIVEERGLVADAYRATFGREGVPVCGFTLKEFTEWISGAPDADFDAIDAFLIGECGDLVQQIQTLSIEIKRRCSAAIIAIKENRSLATTLDLFAQGVDDVVVKPCHAREMLARIEAISRRAKTRTAREADIGDIRTYRDGRDPMIGGELLSLPRRELRILEFLADKSPRRVTKAQIFSAVYGLFDHEIDESVIESHISKLRRRLRERLGYDPIESQRHLGYRLVQRTLAYPCGDQHEVARHEA